GLANSRYTELAQLYQKYKFHGFEILAFPSNQFGNQEPACNEEILQFACTRFKAEYPFLVDKEGHVVDRYAPTTSPLSIEKDLKKLIGCYCLSNKRHYFPEIEDLMATIIVYS
ncbi:hypothetical protein AALP_AAs60074U000100, partial [Arabis alpina]